MCRLWLDRHVGGGVSRAVSSGLLLASAVAVLVWAPASDSAPNARATLMIGKIHADFSDPDRATTYSLPNVSGAAGTVTYSWTLTITPPTGQVDGAKSDDPGCNNHGLLADTEPTFVWHHGNSGDQLHDDGCNHDIYGRWGHQGLITVVVKDGTYYGVCSATYKGSFSTAQNEALGQ